MSHRHPVNQRYIDDRTRAERWADKLSGALGSWPWLVGQSLFLVGWIILNVVGIYGLRWDPRPFILLNLILSLQASYAAPILQLSGNRQAKRDRDRAEHDFQVNEEALQLVREVHRNVVVHERTCKNAPERVGGTH